MRVLVVIRSSTRAKVFLAEIVMGLGAVFREDADPIRSVDAWIHEACARTSNDWVCRSLSVEVHADGADCDHEVPHV